MFGFFKKRPTIDSIQLPDLDWSLVQAAAEMKQWLDPDQAQSLTLNFFALPPDLPTIKDRAVLRHFFRTRIKEAGGGIVEVTVLEGRQLPYVKTIFKFPQEPNGMTYLGSLIFPFKEYSYVVKMQAMEVGTTGAREAVIVGKMMASGALGVGSDDWLCDPYQPELKEGVVMNLAEAEAYDAQFPNHPLSQVRAVLRRLEAEIELDAVLVKVKPFEGT